MIAIEIEIAEEEAWRAEALCRDGSASLVELFFSEQLDDIARAKAFCRGLRGPGRVPRRRRWTGGSRGASGAASCSRTARCSRRSASGGGRPRWRRPRSCPPVIRVQDVLAEKQTA